MVGVVVTDADRVLRDIDAVIAANDARFDLVAGGLVGFGDTPGAASMCWIPQERAVQVVYPPQVRYVPVDHQGSGTPPGSPVPAGSTTRERSNIARHRAPSPLRTLLTRMWS